MLLATITPNNYFMPFEVVKSFFHTLEAGYRVIVAEGPYIYENRNQLFRYAQRKEESILFIDSDIVFKYQDVMKMEEHLKTYHAVTGIYPLGNPLYCNPPYQPALLKRVDEKNDYEFASLPDKFGEIDACGAGFFGFSKELVQNLPRNAFDNVFESSMHGEDISVCYRIKQLGYSIYCDPEIKVGQIRNQIIYS